jgi:phosphoribosylformimino-5-aminoimidazole carboxamide ribotide isomerase
MPTALAPAGAWLDRDRAETLDDLLRRYADGGLRHLLCTDIARDGMLTGPNLDLYRHLRASPGLRCRPRAACATWPTCRRARGRLRRIVLGRALLEGRFALPEALAC